MGRRVRATSRQASQTLAPSREARPWGDGCGPAGSTAAHLGALHLPVDHEQEDTGTRSRHSRAARLLGGAGLPWRRTAWRARQVSGKRDLRERERMRAAARRRRRGGAAGGGASRGLSARNLRLECVWWCGIVSGGAGSSTPLDPVTPREVCVHSDPAPPGPWEVLSRRRRPPRMGLKSEAPDSRGPAPVPRVRVGPAAACVGSTDAPSGLLRPSPPKSL